jgi:hypothetical protein
LDAHEHQIYHSPTDRRIKQSLDRLAQLAELDESIRVAVVEMAANCTTAAGWLLPHGDAAEDPDDPTVLSLPEPTIAREHHYRDTLDFISTATNVELQELSKHMLQRLGDLSDAHRLGERQS